MPLDLDTSSSKNHRTSVLYDFSIVKKAKFYEFQETSVGARDYKFKGHVYSVQINPSQLSTHMDTKKVIDKPAMAPGTTPPRPRDYSSTDSSLNIELRYDVFDEYMVRTADGLLQGAGEDFDLTSENATSLSALMDGYYDPTIAFLFKWGPIEYFGYVESLDFNYSAFSRWGHPLKGIGNLRLSQIRPIDESGKAKSWESALGAGARAVAEAAIASKETLENLALRAEIGATQALR